MNKKLTTFLALILSLVMICSTPLSALASDDLAYSSIAGDTAKSPAAIAEDTTEASTSIAEDTTDTSANVLSSIAESPQMACEVTELQMVTRARTRSVSMMPAPAARL